MSRTLHGFRACAATLTFFALPFAAPGAAHGQGNPDLQAISTYTLTMPKFKQYLEASVNLANAVAKDKTVGPKFQDFGKKSIAEQVKVLEGIPPVRSALVAAGTTPRDYVLTQAAFLPAGMAHAMTKGGNPPSDKMIAEAGINRANLEFMQKNEAEINRLSEDAEARTPAE